jgi:hypothetical protein
MPDPTDLAQRSKFAPQLYALYGGMPVGAGSPLTQISDGHYCRCLHPQKKEENA